MPTTVKFRRGTTAQNDNFTGAEGELSVDLTLDQIRLHDGATAGGFKVARQVDVDDRMQVANAQALFSSAVANLVSTVNVQSYMAVSNTQALVNARLGATSSVTLTGDVTGSASFSSNAVSITTTVADDSHNHVISNVDGLQSALDNRMTVANTQALANARLGATATVAITGAVAGGATAFSSNAVSIAVTQQNNSVALGTHTTGNYVATISGTANEVEVSGSGSESAGVTIGLPDNVTLTGDLTVSGGDITLGGTGRIQGVDTVSSGTDAANKTYVDNAVAGVVDSAPAALDTLNELAAALGDDANFATTVSTNIGQKLGATASITLAGDLTGSASFSANSMTLTAAVVDDSHNHVISNVDGLQTALDGKQATITGGATTITGSNLTASRALVSDGSGKVAVSAVTSTELGYLDGVSSAIQTQLNAKGTMTSFVLEDGDGTEVTISNGKEVKFVEAGGINIDWTDTSTGSDGDPYDLSFSINTGVTAGSGLTGGGTLSSTRTINVGAGTGITVNADDIAVTYGTSSGTACQGNDARLSDSRTCDNTFDNASTARSNLGLGSLATLSTVNASTITDNSVGAAELNVTGNGTTSQFLRSDGDGTFSWVTPTDTNTTYSAGAGLDLGGTTFSVESDLRGDVYYIGQDTNDYIHVNTTVIDFRLDGNLDMRLENDGDLHVDGRVVAYSGTTSDERLKTNITTVTDAVEKVKQLNGVEFEYKADGKKSAGLIAQDVEKVLPQAVTESTLPTKDDTDETEYKILEYAQVTSLLVEAIKEQQEQIESLKSEIENLKSV